MKKISLTLAFISTLLALAPMPAYALECAAGEVIYTDYSVEGGRQYCGPAENSQTKLNSPTPTLSPNPVDPAQQAASNQAYADCMSIPSNSSDVCRQSAGAQTGVAPTNLDIQTRLLTPYLPGIPPQTSWSPSASAPPSSSAIPQNTSGTRLTYTPLEPLPGAEASTYSSLSKYLSYMFTLLLSIGAMIAVVTLVIAGITYMVSEVVDKKSQAKERIRAAFWGLALLLTSWLILHTINPNLLNFSLFDSTVGAPTPGAPTSVQTAPLSAASLPYMTNSFVSNPADPNATQQLNLFNTECQSKNGYVPAPTQITNGQQMYNCTVAP